jgi:hypothetical protein
MITNTLLNINDTDVYNCDNKIQLLSWKSSIDLQRLGIRQKIIKEFKGRKNSDEYRKIMYAFEVNGILNQKIQNRLSELKEERRDVFESLFINKCKLLYPDVYKELNTLIYDEINN